MHKSRMKPSLVALIFGILAVMSLETEAQVHRCTDSNGKTSFSDVPCPITAKNSEQVLGRSATETSADPFAAQRNIESIERARQLQQETVEGLIQQSRGTSGATTMSSGRSAASARQTPAEGEQCETYGTRKGCYGGERARNQKWSTARGYHGSGGPADQQYDAERRARAASAPGQMVNCDAAGCWGSQNGVRYNRVAGGNLQGTNGSFCARGAGNTFSCN